MRIPVIAGNWKMNTTVQLAVHLVNEMMPRLDSMTGVHTILCPPYISLTVVKEIIKDTSVELGAQNMYFEKHGAFTGEISPAMLTGICQFVILGHSERRQVFSESNEMINKKVRAALESGIKPIICVGESLLENESGRTEHIVTKQINMALSGIQSPDDLIIAYEPIWAIGTGKAATGIQANATIGIIRNTIEKLYGMDISQAVLILYGGSVTSANIEEFIKQPEIDGALVGGASLKAEEFIAIIERTRQIKNK